MTIYSNVKDTTMRQPAGSPGLAFRKSCSACGQHKNIAGGSLFSKLRLWRCAACTDKSRSKDE
jgi:hypothetical protein